MNLNMSLVLMLAAVELTSCRSGDLSAPGSSVESVDTQQKTIQLNSTDRTNIRLMYNLSTDHDSSGSYTYATNIIVIVSPVNSWGGSKNVRAALMSNCAPSGGGAGGQAYNHDFELPYGQIPSGFAYTNQLNSLGDNFAKVLVKESGIHVALNCEQEIAVVIDDQWLTDPINKTHNFKFKFQ